MTPLRIFLARLRGLVGRRGRDQDLQQEIASHLDEAAEEYARQGLSPEEARRAARVAFGGTEQAKERYRDQRGVVELDGMLRDLWFGLRLVRRAPTFAGTVVLTLAVGIGAVTTIGTIVYAVLLHPLPYPQADRLVGISEVADSGARIMPSDPNFDDLQAAGSDLAVLAQYSTAQATTIVNGSAELVRAASVSRRFFEVMGVRPAIGREFAAAEAHYGSGLVAIVSDRFWREQLHASADLAAARVTVQDKPVAIIGVMPSGFAFPNGVDAWVLLEQWREHETGRTGRQAFAIGRLRPGVSIGQVQAAFSAVARRLKTQYGPNTSMADAAVQSLQDGIVGNVRPVLVLLASAAVFLLLVVTANVLSLLLARMTARGREMAVRLALGAGWWRIARQLMLETATLACLAGGVGLGLAVWAVGAIRGLGAGDLPRAAELSAGWPALVLASGLAVLVTGVVGAFGAHRAMGGRGGPQLVVGTRTSSGTGRRLRATLVVAQIAMTVVLLIGAGLLVRSLRQLVEGAPGFRTTGVVGMTLYEPPIAGTSFFDRPTAEADTARARRAQELAAIADQVGRLPGVIRTGIVDALPLQGETASGAFLMINSDRELADLQRNIDQQNLQALGDLFNTPGRTGYAGYRSASAGYFETMGIPLERGRLFDRRDTVGSPHVAIISATLARRQWPGRDPIGRRLEFGNMDGDLRPLTIVGVVGDVRDVGLDTTPRALVYTCVCQRPTRDFSIVAYAPTHPSGLGPSMQRIARAADPLVPTRVTSIESVMAAWLEWRRFVLLVLALFAAAALILAVIGIYGTLSYAVVQQRSEMGIRLALGASPGGLRLGVLKGASRLVLPGVALGISVALASSRLLAALLYGVTSTDPVMYGWTAGIVVGLALVSSWIPASRAARLDPTIALRSE